MKICIINPNSDEAMTEVIRDSALAFSAGEFDVDCVTNATAPPFIGSYEDMHESEPGMVAIVKAGQEEYDAFIIACHSDPGLDLLKEVSHKPVIGICEASVKLATMLGHSFSVLSTSKRPIPNKEALVRKYGAADSLASVVGPEGFNPDWHGESGMIELGRRAIEEDHCEVLVLGCAGMGHAAKNISKTLGVPVLDGVTCALIIAQGLIKANITHSKMRRYHERSSK